MGALSFVGNLWTEMGVRNLPKRVIYFHAYVYVRGRTKSTEESDFISRGCIWEFEWQFLLISLLRSRSGLRPLRSLRARNKSSKKLFYQICDKFSSYLCHPNICGSHGNQQQIIVPHSHILEMYKVHSFIFDVFNPQKLISRKI